MAAIRRGDIGDLPAVAAIQQASPEAAGWDPRDYLKYDFRVALCENRVAAFLVTRVLAQGESELLNLAVAPEFRRTGVARTLLTIFCKEFQGVIFLEVRESNAGARSFYKSMGFQELSRREGYYHSPLEAAIVMKFHSC